MKVGVLTFTAAASLMVFGCNSPRDQASPAETTVSSAPEHVASTPASAPVEPTPVPAATPAPAASPTPAGPVLGPKSNAASYKGEIAGGQFRNGEFVQSHFNLITGALSSDFPASKMTFVLDARSVKDAWPKITLSYLPAGVTWTPDNWQILQENLTINRPVTLEFPIAKPAAGRYFFRISYNATDPPVDVRPVLVVKSVELFQ